MENINDKMESKFDEMNDRMANKFDEMSKVNKKSSEATKKV